MQNQKSDDSRSQFAIRFPRMRRVCLRIFGIMRRCKMAFWNLLHRSRKSDAERFLEEPWMVGISGIVRKSHQEGSVTVIDDIDITDVSFLRGTDD